MNECFSYWQLIQKELPIPKPGETALHGNLNIRIISRESSNKLNGCDICLVSTDNDEAETRVYENMVSLH